MVKLIGDSNGASGWVDPNILLNTLLELPDDEEKCTLVEKIPSHIVEIKETRIEPYMENEDTLRVSLWIMAEGHACHPSPNKFDRNGWVHQVITFHSYQWNDIDEKFLGSDNPECEWIWEELVATYAKYNICALPKRFINLAFLTRAYLKYLHTFSNCASQYETPYVLDFLRHVCKRNDIANDLVVNLADIVLTNVLRKMHFPSFAYFNEDYYQDLYQIIDILSSSHQKYKFIKEDYNKFMQRFDRH